MRRVALYNGVFVRHDAISDSLGHKLAILSALADAGVPVEPVVFTHHSDSPDPAIHPERHIFDVVASREFRESDLHWYEFGIAYGLFNTVFAVLPGHPVLAVYHNVTPLELVTDRESRQAVQRSMIQRHNLELADHVVCDSDFNRRDLLDLGIAPDRMSVLALPSAVPQTLDTRPYQAERDPREPVRLVFVGRFVRAKGLIDLVEAVAAVLQRGVEQFHLTLVGNPAFADQPTRDELERLRHHHGLSAHVSLAGWAESGELATLYASADALVLPSYHEGYCVPVIEALGCGAYVIASSAGNLPAIVGGLGTLVTPGDVGALADGIEQFVGAVITARTARQPARLATSFGRLPEEQWRERVVTHLEGHSLSGYRRGVLDLLARYLPDLAAHPAWPDAVAHLTSAGVSAGA